MPDNSENLKGFYQNSPDMFEKRPDIKAEGGPPQIDEATEAAQRKAFAARAILPAEVKIDAEAFYTKTKYPEQIEFLDAPVTKGDKPIPVRINIEAIPAHIIKRLREAYDGIGPDLQDAATHYIGTMLGLGITDEGTGKTLRQLHGELDGFRDHDGETLDKIVDVLRHLTPVKT